MTNERLENTLKTIHNKITLSEDNIHDLCDRARVFNSRSYIVDSKIARERGRIEAYRNTISLLTQE